MASLSRFACNGAVEYMVRKVLTMYDLISSRATVEFQMDYAVDTMTRHLAIRLVEEPKALADEDETLP